MQRRMLRKTTPVIIRSHLLVNFHLFLILLQLLFSFSLPIFWESVIKWLTISRDENTILLRSSILTKWM